ncbi:ammonium transporter [Desertimonas flava]|uniref:ammonium transporter n=1 Tax=Desertimonas flava TaxID=2064846 RepID=UPI000E3433DC
MRQRALRIISGLGGTAALIYALPSVAGAQTDGPDSAAVQAVLDNIWVFIAGCLVFFMQAGFALVEAGLTRSKNVVNIFAKNLSDALIGIIAFFAVGFAFAFGPGGGDFIGSDMFFLSGADLTIPAEGGLSVATTFFFQAVFAATAVTIASGAMAERTKFVSYLIISAVMTAFIYPVVVHWTWGGGMIAGWNIGDAVYSDFAGSGIVHMSGGLLGLVGTLFLGPRIGKYDSNGKPRAIPGHNIPFVVLGTFILWLGWFGFNPGSELAADSYVITVAVNTMLAAAAGGVATTITIWVWKGKPDLGMICNGVLAGLVAITAPCGAVNGGMSLIIGAVGGVLVVAAVLFLDRIKVDDPVGAVSVHGVCGLWGLLSIGLFAQYDDAFLGREDAGLFYGGGFEQLAMQAVMAAMIILWVGGTASILMFILKKTIGLRVTAEEETEGLDELEHGIPGYPADVSFS